MLAYIKINIEEQIAVIQLDRGSANPMNHQLVSELRVALKEAQTNEQVLGAIIHGKPNFFSAGLDLPELYNYNEQQFADFWQNFMDLIADLIAFNKPLIASITGHAPAGGCIIAIGCDYRVMAEGNYKIGLNEIPVGIIVPKPVFDLYSFWLGQRTAYQYLLEGKLYSPEHAKAIGLVDEVVDANEVLHQAKVKLLQYFSYEQNGWRATKRQMRKDLLQSI
ncbi:MAG: enoyl-CoA hydratase/isomerase family protein, partial [Chitinophagales bacterium]